MEFDLIQTFFQRPAKHRGVILGNGDDCALLQSKHTLAFSTDSLIEGTHFIQNEITPADLGYRALAVNLSDLSAMGASPLAFLLSLTLPHVDEAWLALFSKGLFSLADEYHIDLIGGNTTTGSLAITIQIIGTLPTGKALLRSAAKVGDPIYVTGRLGEKKVRPTPRIHFASHLLPLAHAAIDISDGLTQDLSHILNASHCGAVLDLSSLPTHNLDAALYGGEDYELCFTAPLSEHEALVKMALETNTPLSRIGEIVQKPGLWQVHNQTWTPLKVKGYQHF